MKIISYILWKQIVSWIILLLSSPFYRKKKRETKSTMSLQCNILIKIGILS